MRAFISDDSIIGIRVMFVGGENEDINENVRSLNGRMGVLTGMVGFKWERINGVWRELDDTTFGVILDPAADPKDVRYLDARLKDFVFIGYDSWLSDLLSE